MIIDSLANADRYAGMHEGFEEAFAYLKSQDLAKLEPGKYPVDGTEMTVAVSAKNGVPMEDAKFEAHDRHIDIQVCIAGREQMGWKPRDTAVSPQGAYSAEKDVTFFNDRPDMYFQLQPGQFAIFFPDDIHAPMIGEELIHKMVVKVKV